MFSTQPGGVAVESQSAPDRPDPAEQRRRHDEAAHEAARQRAMTEALALLAVLHSSDSPLELVVTQAREAMRAAGLCWETAARLLDK